MIRRIFGYYRTVREDLRYQNLGVSCWRALVKLTSPVAAICHQILFEIDLTQPIPERHARVECLIEPATAADLDAIVESRFPSLPQVDPGQLSDLQEFDRARYEREIVQLRGSFRASCEQWLRNGDICFVARIDGEIAHSNWIQFHCPGATAARPIPLREDEVYTTEGYTDERWRGQGIHEAVASRMLRYAQSRGCHRAYTITDLVKAGARRGVLRIGWKQRGHHLFITPRNSDRTWIIRLGGDTEPILRGVTPGPAPSTNAE